VTLPLPRAQSTYVDNSGRPTTEFYKWLQSVERESGGDSSGLALLIRQIAEKLGSVDGSVAGIPDVYPGLSSDTSLVGIGGQIQVSGTLASGEALVGLASLADSGAGELLAVERDDFGRVSGTRSVLPSDIPSPLWTFLVDPDGNYLTDADGALLRAPGVDLSQLGAGTTSSETVLRGDGDWSGGIQSSGGAGNFSWNVRGYGRPPGLQLDRAQGTPSAPTAVTSGLVIGTQIYRGWDGSAFSNGAQIRGLATENWTPTARGSRLDFQTVAIGAATQILRAELDSDNFRPAANLWIGLGSAARNWNGVYSNAFYSGASQVVGPRNTGWLAMTGTGSKATIAALPAGLASAVYVQLELQVALNRIAALEARMKALDDALFAHGLIGA
jgi:hypothetical protein